MATGKRRVKTKDELVPAKDEHIFPQSQLVPLAVRWKELNAKGRHTEAMLVLEQIVVLSTPMFERLAQHEEYHNTVDLGILVSAAQEKVIKWLLKWEPRKGRLFSWFCLHEKTPILTEDGTLRLIGDLVKERYSGRVMCWNADKKKFEAKKVTGWNRQPCTRKEWRKLTIRGARGYPHPVYITHEHRVFTQAGWVPVDWLNPRDLLYVDSPRLTPDGQAAKIRLEPVKHRLVAAPGEPSWEVSKVFKILSQGKQFRDVEAFKWKYDLTVEGNHNFFAGKCKLLVHNSKCAKHAFLSELVKVNQYKKRYFSTGDNLEKFHGTEDHESDKHNLTEEFNRSLKDLFCRWGCRQEQGALRYLCECLVHDLDNHDKQAAIRGAAYAWCISMELAKFFYSWVLVALRDIHYHKIRVPFTEEDIIRHWLSHTSFVNLYDRFTHDQIKWLIATHGGQRIKVPSLSQLLKAKEDYAIFSDVEKSDKDPDSVADIAKKRKRTPRSAQEAFAAMVENTHPNRSGEYPLYSNDDVGYDHH